MAQERSISSSSSLEGSQQDLALIDARASRSSSSLEGSQRHHVQHADRAADVVIVPGGIATVSAAARTSPAGSSSSSLEGSQHAVMLAFMTTVMRRHRPWRDRNLEGVLMPTNAIQVVIVPGGIATSPGYARRQDEPQSSSSLEGSQRHGVAHSRIVTPVVIVPGGIATRYFQRLAVASPLKSSSSLEGSQLVDLTGARVLPDTRSSSSLEGSQRCRVLLPARLRRGVVIVPGGIATRPGHGTRRPAGVVIVPGGIATSSMPAARPARLVSSSSLEGSQLDRVRHDGGDPAVRRSSSSLEGSQYHRWHYGHELLGGSSCSLEGSQLRQHGISRRSRRSSCSPEGSTPGGIATCRTSRATAR